MAFCPKGRFYDETRFPHCEGCDCGLVAGVAAPSRASSTVYEEPLASPAAPGPQRAAPWIPPPPRLGPAGAPNPQAPAPFAGPGGAGGTVYSEAQDAADRLMGFLVVLASRDDAGRYYRLREGGNPIGKFETGCSIGLHDHEASAAHALRVCTNTATRLVDLDSTNGTQVNGGRTQYAELQEGDVIRIGRPHLAYVPFGYIVED